jgi:hypothetical protein
MTSKPRQTCAGGASGCLTATRARAVIMDQIDALRAGGHNVGRAFRVA